MAATDPVEAPRIADFARYRVEPGERIALADHDPGDTGPYASAEEAGAELGGLVERIADFQERLYAEEWRAVLVVLQGIDAAGKDSTVKHVFREANPQGCRVYAFKQPSREEQAHDFLWRYHQRHARGGDDPRLQPLPLRGRAGRARPRARARAGARPLGPRAARLQLSRRSSR